MYDRSRYYRAGIFSISNYWPVEKCVKARQEIDRIFSEYADQIQKDEHQSDHRLFGAERASALIKEFHGDPFLIEICRGYYQAEVLIGMTLANVVIPREHNLGSGGGWHRDSVHQRRLKPILYLSDVSEENGPYQHLMVSQTARSLLKTISEAGIKFKQNRFTQAEVEKIARLGKNEIKTMTGKAGTLLLTDTRAIHRGAPIQKGSRYALTNYTYAKHMMKKEEMDRRKINV